MSCHVILQIPLDKQDKLHGCLEHLFNQGWRSQRCLSQDFGCHGRVSAANKCSVTGEGQRLYRKLRAFYLEKSNSDSNSTAMKDNQLLGPLNTLDVPLSAHAMRLNVKPALPGSALWSQCLVVSSETLQPAGSLSHHHVCHWDAEVYSDCVIEQAITLARNHSLHAPLPNADHGQSCVSRLFRLCLPPLMVDLLNEETSFSSGLSNAGRYQDCLSFLRPMPQHISTPPASSREVRLRSTDKE
ncbi:hypothetical protein cypCar_00014897 [Cyprinus carpio]|nr:hypothetical protein cypCar_00014897 [Cyprinus carpio]